MNNELIETIFYNPRNQIGGIVEKISSEETELFREFINSENPAKNLAELVISLAKEGNFYRSPSFVYTDLVRLVFTNNEQNGTGTKLQFHDLLAKKLGVRSVRSSATKLYAEIYTKYIAYNMLSR